MLISPAIRTTLVALAAVTAAATVGAAPSANQADKFRVDLRQAVDQGVSHIDTVTRRQAHRDRLQELSTRAERLFGDDPKFGACVRSTKMLMTAWTDQSAMAGRSIEAKEVAVNYKGAFDTGAEYFACRTAIDALSPAKASDECLVRFDVAKDGVVKERPRPLHCAALDALTR